MKPTTTSELFRVREPDWSEVWGENLTRDEAQRLKHDVVANRKKSRVTTIRPMSEEVPDWMRGSLGDAETAPRGELGDAETDSALISGMRYEIGGPITDQIKRDGTIIRMVAGHILLVNGQERPVPCRVQRGEQIECRALNPAIAAVRGAAHDAVTKVIRDKRRVYQDVTVRKPVPRTRPPIPDHTVKASNLVRLGAPPAAPAERFMAPWLAAQLQDGKELPPDAVTDDDLSDIASDIGGVETPADVEHAKRQAAERDAR